MHVKEEDRVAQLAAPACAVAVVGLVFLGEPLNWAKALSLVMIVAGVVGLNLAGAH